MSVPTMRRASEASLASRGSTLRDDLALAQHGRPVAQAQHFLQAMGDVKHRASVTRQPLQCGEQDFRFLRRQHRGRLVEDEKLGVLQQAAHDLDALALADRELVHKALGVERQAEGGGDFHDALGHCAQILARRQRERDILRDRQGLEEREMLEHHAYAERARRRGRGDGERPAFPGDRALIGLQGAIEHFDEGGFAGAVLAQKGVDLAGLDIEIDAVIGGEIAEALDDPARREPRKLRASFRLHFEGCGSSSAIWSVPAASSGGKTSPNSNMSSCWNPS